MSPEKSFLPLPSMYFPLFLLVFESQFLYHGSNITITFQITAFRVCIVLKVLLTSKWYIRLILPCYCTLSSPSLSTAHPSALSNCFLCVISLLHTIIIPKYLISSLYAAGTVNITNYCDILILVLVSQRHFWCKKNRKQNMRFLSVCRGLCIHLWILLRFCWCCW